MLFRAKLRLRQAFHTPVHLYGKVLSRVVCFSPQMNGLAMKVSIMKSLFEFILSCLVVKLRSICQYVLVACQEHDWVET